MLLVLDIGNTNTSIGIFEGGETKKGELAVQASFSSADRTSDEAGLLLNSLLHSNGISREDIGGAVLCSVVPRLEAVWKDAIKAYVGVVPLAVSDRLDLGMRI